MKDAFYFPHDYNARNDQKVLMLRGEFGLEGYALYFMILESMAEEGNGYLNREAIGGLSVGYGVSKDLLTRIIDYCIHIKILYEKSDGIYSKRMIEHKNFRNGLSNAGKAGAKKRWENREAISHPISTPNAKERKGKEIKEKEIYNNTTIVVATPQSFGNSDVNEILEKIKIYNNNIIDGTQKEQRQYGKMLFDKLKQIDSVKNNNYSAAGLLEIILQIISKNEYHSHKIVGPKKIYYELAGLMQICKQEMQKEKKSTVKEF